MKHVSTIIIVITVVVGIISAIAMAEVKSDSTILKCGTFTLSDLDWAQELSAQEAAQWNWDAEKKKLDEERTDWAKESGYSYGEATLRGAGNFFDGKVATKIKLTVNNQEVTITKFDILLAVCNGDESRCGGKLLTYRSSVRILGILSSIDRDACK